MSGPVTLAVVLLGLFGAGEAEKPLFGDEARDFAGKVDVSPLASIGVQLGGRVGIMDTRAREIVALACGAERIEGLEPTFAFLELYFNAGAYIDRPVIYVRERNMRRKILDELDGQAKTEFEKTHRLRPFSLMNAKSLGDLLSAGRLGRSDLERARGSTPDLSITLSASEEPEFRLPLERLGLRLSAFMGVGGTRILPAEDGRLVSVHAGLAAATARAAGREPGPHVKEATAAILPEFAGAPAQLADLRDAWRRRDADEANRLIAELSAMLTDPRLNPACPTPLLRRLEAAYNHTYHATVVWVGFAASLVFWVAAAAGWRAARPAALILLAVSTAALLAGFVVRWLLSGRAWYLPPVMDQFESVTGAALLAAIVAVVLELFRRRNYFGLAASLCATVALLAGFFAPASGAMSPAIGVTHGILDSPVMAAHVSVIITAHAFVGMTMVISAAYLLAAAIRGLPNEPGDERGGLATIGRCNLIVVHLACWTLVLGTVLGAYWGDFAWGRWWGWDPKETWALINVLVYVGIIHVRMITRPRWRDAVTAILCVVGCGVMLFNWIYVNFFMAGMHSYA